MWWLVGIYVAIILFSRLDDLIELFKSKDPNYQKIKQQEQTDSDLERQEILQQLKDFQGCDCQIRGTYLHLMNESNQLNGTIVNIEQDWVEITSTKGKKTKHYIININDIDSISRVLSQ